MSITYTWAITDLKTKTEGSNADSVVQTSWQKIGTDEDGNVGIFNGATPFSSVDADPYVPFEDLTESIVVGWVQAIVVEDYEIHVNAMIAKGIANAIDPTVQRPAPWVVSK